MKDFAKSIVCNTKTGNGILDILKSEKPIKMKSSKGEIVTIHPDGSAAHQDKEGSQMAVHHYNSFKEAVEYYKNQGYVKVGNISASITTDGNTWFVTTSDGKKEEFTSEREAEAYVKKIKTGNDTPWEYAHRKPKVINDDKTGAEEFFKQLSDDVKEREKKDDADIEKVGNALNWDENLVGKFVWVKDKGQEWKVYVMQDKGDKVYIRDDDNGSQGWVSKTRITGKVGNTRTGNQSYKFYGEVVDIAKTDTNTLKEILEELRALHEQGDFQRAIKDELNKRKVGNSAQDDKFAYVMREFDEGKLKTPDGKVVTDPAQAKAIAYSESKKTENGLARARNAMAGNKKAIGSYFNMNNYGIEVGQWSWDWKNGAPDKKTMDDTARKIKDYVRQIDKNVPDGDNDERDEVFAKLDRFMHSQGLK